MAHASRNSTSSPYHRFQRRSRQALTGIHLPTEGELLRGMGFFRDDVREDIREFASRVARHIRLKDLQGFEPLLELLDDLATVPGIDTLALLEERLWNCPDVAALPAESFRTRCRIYRATCGDADAAAFVAAEIAALALEDVRSGHGSRLVWRSLGWAVHSRRMEGWLSTGADIRFARNHQRDNVHGYAKEFRQAFYLASKPEEASERSGPAARTPNKMTEDIGSRSDSGVVVLRTIGMATSKGKAEVGKDYKDLVGKRLPLSPVPDIGQVRQNLLEEFPYAASVIETILNDLSGHDHVRIRPTLLIGPPGAGKTHFARRLAQELKTPWDVIPCGGVADSMHGGGSRKWATGEPSLPVTLIRTHQHAGPMIILDEVEKTGSGRYNGNLHDVLHGLLERETAARWRDPYIDAPCDLSHISWVMTANTVEPIPKTLRDRCRCIRFPEPGPEHLASIAQRMLAESYSDKGFDPEWALPLDGVEIEALSAAWPGGSMRILQRIVERLIEVREKSMTRC